MIRKAVAADNAALALLWLESSLKAYPFIEADFWHKKLPLVEHYYLRQGITYVSEQDKRLQGFLTLNEPDFIGGLFVVPALWRHKLGTALLAEAKQGAAYLELEVYAQNAGAVAFYQNQEFLLIGVRMAPETGEAILRMRWEHGL